MNQLFDYVALYEKESVLLQIRCRIQQMFLPEEPDKQDMADLWSLIHLNEHNVSSESIAEMFTFLRNYCTILVNKGYLELQELLHEIQKDNLSKGYFFTNGKLQHYSMMNITLVPRPVVGVCVVVLFWGCRGTSAAICK